MCGLTSQNHQMIIKDTIVECLGNFDHPGFFNVYLNVNTRTHSNFAFIRNAAAEAGILSRVLGEEAGIVQSTTKVYGPRERMAEGLFVTLPLRQRCST